MSGIELATQGRGQRGRDYPPSWGEPPGAIFSEERAAWVRANVRKMQADPEVRSRQLARAQTDLGTARLRGLAALAANQGNLVLAAQIETMARQIEAL